MATAPYADRPASMAEALPEGSITTLTFGIYALVLIQVACLGVLAYRLSRPSA